MGKLGDRAGVAENVKHWTSSFMVRKLKGPDSLYAAHHSFHMEAGWKRVKTRCYEGETGKGSCQLKTSSAYLLLMGMEKEGRIFIVEVGRGVGDSPCLWSVPRKQDNAPCPGLIGSRSAPS